MAERNRHVPFPELTGKGSALEGLVVSMAEKRILPYAQLPETISATQIETYANWISQLTKQDSKGAERGAALHIRADNKRIIFPSNPDVGDERECGWAISKKRDKFIPTIDVHSHPSNVCHSGSPGDLGTLIAGWKPDNFVPTGMLVATPEHNYLMIKSQETIREDDQWTVSKKTWDPQGHEKFMRFRRFGSTLGQEIQNTTEYFNIFEGAEAQSFAPYGLYRYYESFIEAITAAEIYNLGFYKSKKDGRYERITRPRVLEHIKDKFDKALIQALRNH